MFLLVKSVKDGIFDHRLIEIAKGELISLLTAIPNHGSETNSPLSGIEDKLFLLILQDNAEEKLSTMPAIPNHTGLRKKKALETVSVL